MEEGIARVKPNCDCLKYPPPFVPLILDAVLQLLESFNITLLLQLSRCLFLKLDFVKEAVGLRDYAYTVLGRLCTKRLNLQNVYNCYNSSYHFSLWYSLEQKLIILKKKKKKKKRFNCKLSGFCDQKSLELMLKNSDEFREKKQKQKIKKTNLCR